MNAVEENVVVRFLEAVLHDSQQGRRGALDDYLARFPGHESRLTAEWAALEAGADEAGLGDAGDTADGGPRFGPYRLLRELGRGGQGVVHLAEDTRFRRTVALKLLPGFAGTGVPARVQREVEAIARLDHPGLCVVFEAGQLDGQAFLAMRYVPGEPLEVLLARDAGLAAQHGETSAVGGARTRVVARVELMEKVARALHAAHEAGVVHRDVKPANILVHPETGEPVVVDFGLARADETSVPTLTRTGDLVGTTQYMSPQRLAGEGSRDPRTDVWSLGVTLYEAVTGRRPFDGPTVEAVARRIESEEPPDPRRLCRGVDRDLAVVMATALEKSTDRRYATALAFADDLARVRRGEPVLARPVSSLERLRRWTARNPAPAGLLVLLAVGLLASAWAAWRMSELADNERSAREESQALLVRSDFAQVHLLELAEEPGRRWKILDLLRDAAAARLAAGDAALDAGRVPGVPTPLALREAALAGLFLTDARRVATLQRSSFGAGSFSADGSALALAWVAPDFTSFGMRVLDTADGRETARLDDGQLLSAVHAVAVEEGGARFVTPRRDLTALGVWDAASGTSAGSLHYPGALRPQAGESVWRLAWQPGGSLLAGATGPKDDGSTAPSGWALWTVDQPEPLQWDTSEAPGAPYASFSHDGRWLAVPAGLDAVDLVDTASMERRRVVLGDEVLRAIPTSGDAPRLVAVVRDAVAAADRLVVTGVAGDGTADPVRLEEMLPDDVDLPVPLALDPDERFVMLADETRTLRVYDLSGLQLRVRVAEAQAAPIDDVAFRGTSTRLLSHASKESSTRWEAVLGHDLAHDLPPGPAAWTAQGGAPFAVSPDASRVARLPPEDPLSIRVAAPSAAGTGGGDVVTGESSLRAPLIDGPVRLLVIDDAGVVARFQAGGFDVWRPSVDGVHHERTDFDEGWSWADARIAPSGGLAVLTQHASGEAVLRVEGRELGRARLPVDAQLWLDDAGQRVLVAPTEGRRPPMDLASGALRCVDLRDGTGVTLDGIAENAFREVAGGTSNGAWVAAHVFLPPDVEDASASADIGSNAVWVWSARTGAVAMRVPHDYRLRVVPSAISPDGTLFVMNAMGGRVRLFDPARGEELVAWRAHENNVDHLSFRELDGRLFLLTHARSEPARLWDLGRMRDALASMGLDW